MLDCMGNRSCFTLDALGTRYLGADSGVGILPLPKYDAAQESYAHVNWGNNVVVPSTIKKTACDGNSQFRNLVYLSCFPILNNNPAIDSYYRQNETAAQKWPEKLTTEK